MYVLRGNFRKEMVSHTANKRRGEDDYIYIYIYIVILMTIYIYIVILILTHPHEVSLSNNSQVK